MRVAFRELAPVLKAEEERLTYGLTEVSVIFTPLSSHLGTQREWLGVIATLKGVDAFCATLTVPTSGVEVSTVQTGTSTVRFQLQVVVS